ncbi:hypothetical protein PLICRDRAFT_54749 [Plicaturopsis crispa FD-325 SS-3]|nr:hypothetical protein PLICRDRAFT_54749 [Plicaturopsis crispa FD-325 SS-3]
MPLRQSTFPRSGVLVLGPNSVQSLLPSTLISQAESLLESHRIEEATQLADQQWKRLQGKPAMDSDESDELQYVYQRIGFQCLGETLFEDAGRALFAGELDPRILVSYFPELRGSLFEPTDALDVFAGVAEHMPPEASIDDLIVANLVRNYSPHLSPNTRSAPSTAELRKILGFAANDMLELFLRKSRTRQPEQQKGNAVVDTVLAKLLSESEKTTDLYNLIQEKNSIVLSEIEPVLKRTGQYNALCMIYRQRGDDEKLLETWSKLVDGEWTDEDIAEPLTEMFTLLSARRDRALTQRWGIWLTKHDPERALKLITSRDSSARRKTGNDGDDVALLQQIRDVNVDAGAQFLEHLVLQKRSTSRELHAELANAYVGQLAACLADSSTSKLWRAKASSYASSRNESSFLSYFASTTPESEHKRVRLKTALFLQGSALYDVGVVRERLTEHRKILSLEMAILDGKLGNHRDALAILVHDLHDATSAEAYCTLGGEVIPGKTAQAIGEKYGLQLWSGAFFSPPSSGKNKSGATAMLRQQSVDEGLKRELLKILLEVYMRGGESTADRTAHLLNSQAMNLDVVDVISLVPPNWPLTVVSSFLARSFRRTLHTRHEGQIIKAISAGQNLEVADRTWLVLREQGALVEEADEEDGDGDDGQHYDEKDGIVAEKVALQLQDMSTPTHDLTETALKSVPHDLDTGDDTRIGT